MLFSLFQLPAAALSLLLLKLLTKFKIEGRNNLALAKKPFLIVSNHESHYDPQLIGALMMSRPSLFPLRYMAKDILFLVPGLNLLIWLLGAFRAYKKRGIERSLKVPMAVLRRGGVVVMFPEGRMVVERPKLGDGRRGAALLALSTGAQILPLSLHSPHDLLPLLPLSGKGRPSVTVRVGEPFYLDKKQFPDTDDDSVKRATKFIMQKIADLYYRHEY